MAKPELETIPTRASLLRRLKEGDDPASWEEFHRIYGRLIQSVVVKQGVSEPDVPDVVQETFLAVAKAISTFEYDPARAAFKTWLMRVTHHRILDHFRRKKTRPQFEALAAEDPSRTPALERIADPGRPDLEAIWDEEWERNLTDLALEQLKPQVNAVHFQVFYLLVIKQQAPRKVAEALDVSLGQVYLVKHRLTPLFRKLATDLRGALG